ncbi:MAG: glycosyltransferase family 4 protein [Bacteroidota bacterium]
MKILLVSWSILPNKGGSSIIVENLAQNFDADELVVLGSRKFRQEEVIDRPAGSPSFKYFFSEMYFMGRGYRYFIWFRKWRFKPLINAIKNLIKEEKIDYVVGVYPNPFYCHAACLAAKEMGVPFSSYFHNTYVDNIAITDPEAKVIQQEIFEASEYIFVMSKGMQQFYEEQYGLKKFFPLVHTFNTYPPEYSYSGIPGVDKDKYKLVAIGNFNESNMDATLRFANTIYQNPKYSLSLFTHVPRVLLRKRGLDTNAIEYEGFVQPDQVHRVLQEYDLGVLTHGFTGGYGEVEYRTIFPTRMIPLLLSGKPLIVHSPKGSFLNDFVQEHQCAELVDDPSPEAILEGLDRICTNEDYQKQLVEASRKTVAQFHGPHVVKELKKLLMHSQSVVHEADV